MRSIGENLKVARHQAGLTQKEVESLLGLRELSLRDYETERLKLPAEMAVKFSILYHVSVDELLRGPRPLKDETQQLTRLTQLEFLFTKGEFEMVLLDPVIRATLEEFPEKIIDHSIFELLTLSLSEKQKKDVTLEFLKSIGSLLGLDYQITEAELSFFTRLSVRFEVDETQKVITKSLSLKSYPDVRQFHHSPGLRHFLIWVLFFVSKSEGVIGTQDLDYIQECAEKLRLHRSHFLAIKKFFVREIH